MDQDDNLSASSRARWRSLFETTLAWLESEIDRFLLGADADPVRHLARLKPLAELALACDIGLTILAGAAQGWGLEQAGRLRRLLDVLRDDVGEGSRLTVLLGSHPKPKGVQLSALSTLAECLQHWGALSSWPRVDWPEAIRGGVVDTDSRWLVELDVIAVCRHLGFDAPSLHWSAVGIQLAAHPTLSRDAAYTLTHVVFFRTDFGRSPDGLGAVEAAWLRVWGHVWQQQFADALDFDLLGEVTMMLRCLCVCNDAFDVAKVLRRGQEANGAIVANQATDLPAEAGEDAACDWFRRRYHTTLVANMAAALSLAQAKPRGD